jgi:hypothetical protein
VDSLHLTDEEPEVPVLAVLDVLAEPTPCLALRLVELFLFHKI